MADQKSIGMESTGDSCHVARSGGALVTVGNFLFRFRNGLFPVACLLLLLPGPRIWESHASAALLGALVALVGQLLRVLTIGLEYIVRGGRKGRVYADGLVVSGVYAVCRNPMYVGNLLIIAGLAMASNCWPALLVVGSLALFSYVAIVAAEEAYLRGRFAAAYEAYCAEVPRWLPNPRELARALSGGPFRWRRVIVKEYGTPAAWISILCLVWIYNIHRHGASPSAEVPLVVALALVALGWFIVRNMKKSRALTAD